MFSDNLTDHKSACKHAISRSCLLPESDKADWLTRVDSWTNIQCERFLEVMGKESEFLTKELRTILNKTLVAGDKDTIEAFKRTLTKATRSVSAKEEAHDKIEESKTLKNLESDLNAL